MQWHNWLTSPSHPTKQYSAVDSALPTILVSRVLAARLILAAADAMAWMSYALPANWQAELGLRDDSEQTEIRQALRKWLAEPALQDALQHCPELWVSRTIAPRLELNSTQEVMVLLGWLVQSDHAFFEILDNIRVRNLADGIAFIGRCVNCPRAEYAFVVDENNQLWSFLLLERNAKAQTLAGCVLPDQMLRRLYRRCQMDGVKTDVIHQEIDREIARSIGSFRALNMPRQQFAYVPDLNGLQTYLQQCLERKLPGRNILIFGPSGSGKTSLVSSLACWLNIRALFINATNADGDSVDEEVRLGRLELAQQLFRKQQRTILVMDDASMAIWHASKQTPECWNTRYFNDDNIPCIWISDSMTLGNAEFIQRMNYVVLLEDEHQDAVLAAHKVRLNALPVTLPYRQWLARFKWLSPLLIKRLEEFALTLNPDKPRHNEHKISQYLYQSISLNGIALTLDDYLPGYLNPEKAVAGAYHMPEYEVRWLNASLDITKVLSNLEQSPSSSLCLYGQSGTGKSAFADKVAQVTGKEIIRLTGSDLLSRFVGATEEKIAANFSAAQRKGAILVLDEVDSLLISRDISDRKSWEISQVNEMLMAIERFRGILIVTSNRFEHMDSAMSRRFDIKIHFDWMSSKQLRSLMEAILIMNKKSREIQRLSGIPDSMLSSIRTSPGKVKGALRGMALMSTPLTARSLLAAVTEASRLDIQPVRRPIGFVPAMDVINN